MKTIAQYICEICNCQYDSEEKARECEALGVDKPIVKVGDIVTLGKGFGWYDGNVDWISNPDVLLKRAGARCPNGHSNCFDSCCNYEFYYVVTAIDVDPRDGHRTCYHVETRAMSGDDGHRDGYTFNENHHRPVLVKDPPATVVKSSKALIGHKAKYLF